jgi:hypothetical protein
MLAAAADECKKRRLSMAELNISIGNPLAFRRQMLLELGNGSYYGYQIGPNLFRNAGARILAAIEEAQRIGRERLTDQSPQAKAGEAQLAARHVWGTDKDTTLSGLSRLRDFPIADGFAKDDSGERLKDYMIDDLPLAKYATPARLRLKPSRHETQPGFIEMVKTLARDGTNLFEHPNPLGRIKTALAREAERDSRMLDKRWGQSPGQPDNEDEDANEFFDVQQAVWSDKGLVLDKDAVRNAGRNSDSNIIVNLDLEQVLKEAGLSPDQIRVAKAIGAGLEPRSANAHRVLGMERRQYERIRRSLAPDRKAGMAALESLRKYFAIYNPTEDPRK